MARTLVMGVVNVTPDSFSDGGHFLAPQAAIDRGRTLIDEGADLLDIGGESTRPGAIRPDVATELRRVLPVIEGLAGQGVPLSIDTMRAEVARAAVEYGATIINDVSGGLADPEMFSLVAELKVDYILQHWRSHSVSMDDFTSYGDVVNDVRDELCARIQVAKQEGISAEHIIVDPGIGFAKEPHHNWSLLARLDVLLGLGHRLLIGASRKRFLGELLDGREPVGRDDATAAVTAWCAREGVWAVRTHTVRAHRDAITVIERLVAG